MIHETSKPLDVLPIFVGELYCQSLTALAFRIVSLSLACGKSPKIKSVTTTCVQFITVLLHWFIY